MEAKDWANFLLEIRRSIFKIVAIIVIVSFAFFPFSGNVISFVIEETYPYPQVEGEKIKEFAKQLREIADKLENNPSNKTLVYEEIKTLSRLATSFLGPVVLTPLEAIILSLKISIALGIACAIPYILTILAKTLRARGWLRVSVKPYAMVALLLFALGCVYGFFIVRFIIGFLHGLTLSYGVTPLYSLSEFVTFVLFMILLFGFFFEIPVVMFFLVRNNVVQYGTLKYYRRHAYVLFFVLAAIATPTVDVFTQTMLALPMIVLFELGLALIRFLNPARS
ncbi:MAG: twin-arginine translocase subunit TatC [Archaeoglobaceae archaeon]